MEITKKNFTEKFREISDNLKRSCFVGFDAEFTAILASDSFKHRLFDTNEERYDRIKNEASKMIMSQVGLTMFQYDRDRDSYNAISYTFYLCPQVVGDIDQSFIFQASTLRFQCRHNFDYNKFIYEGIHYLNREEENKLRSLINDDKLTRYLSQNLDIHHGNLLQQYCSEVSKWLTEEENKTMYIDIDDPILRLLIHYEVRLRFPAILTTDSLGDSNKILIYKNEKVEGATNMSKEILNENFLNSLLGFSLVIRLLEEYKKPIIGHNNFLDYIILHNQFIGPLPNKYSQFKKNITNMFPILFDTKYISHEMKYKLTFDETWKTNSLQELYEFFTEGKCKKLDEGSNRVKLMTPFDYKQSYHEAGWDSYCSGYCFIRLGHWLACENIGKQRPVSPAEKLAALSMYCNKINIIRAAVPYMNLVGDDPPSNRPNFVYLRSINGTSLNVEKVAALLSSYGSIDMKPYGSRAALIAANSQFVADRIIQKLKNSREYKASVYNVYKHSRAASIAMWSSAVVTGGILFLLLKKKLKC